MENRHDVFPAELDLRGKTVRLRSGRVVSVPAEAERWNECNSFVKYRFKGAESGHTFYNVFQNTSLGVGHNELDAVEVLENETPSEPPPATTPPATGPGVGGWWLVRGNVTGRPAALAGDQIVSVRTLGPGDDALVMITLRSDEAWEVRQPIGYTTDPREAIAWVQSGGER